MNKNTLLRMPPIELSLFVFFFHANRLVRPFVILKLLFTSSRLLRNLDLCVWGLFFLSFFLSK